MGAEEFVKQLENLPEIEKGRVYRRVVAVDPGRQRYYNYYLEHLEEFRNKTQEGQPSIRTAEDAVRHFGLGAFLEYYEMEDELDYYDSAYKEMLAEEDEAMLYDYERTMAEENYDDYR